MYKTRVAVSDLQKGKIQHKELPKHLVKRIKAYKKILKDVEPAPLKATLEDFRRDSNPEREIAVWEKIALSFKNFCKSNPEVSQEEKQIAFIKILRDSFENDLIRDFF